MLAGLPHLAIDISAHEDHNPIVRDRKSSQTKNSDVSRVGAMVPVKCWSDEQRPVPSCLVQGS
jgi:hypothetical protein